MHSEEKDRKIVDVSDLQNGPVSEASRECRDIPCCLLFVACWGGMIYLAVYGYMNGNPYNAFRGVDQAGGICGDVNNPTYTDYPYLYFTNPNISFARRTCVSSCPSWNGTAITPISCAVASTCNTNSSYTITYDNTGAAKTGSPPPTSSDYLGYDSYLQLNRICVPISAMYTSGTFSSSVTTFSNIFSGNDLASLVNDIKNNWYYLLAAAGFAFVVALVFLLLLRCCAGCMVWIFLFAFMLFIIALGLVFLYNANQLGALTNAATFLGVPTFDTGYNSPIGWTLIGVGCGFFILVLCCCGRIRLAVAICKIAGHFVSDVCLIIFVPIFQAILIGCLWAGCLITMVYLVSASTFRATSNSYISYVDNCGDPALIRFYVFIFCTLWVTVFLGAMGIFVVASACCMWYFSHAPGNELRLPIWRSYKMIFRYHLGSLAIGSLLLTVVQFLQMIVEFFKRQQAGVKNSCLKAFCCIIGCLLACVQCIVKFINTLAYIQIALRGKNFCAAARDGFELAWSNPLRYAVVGGIGMLMMFLGKLAIAAITAFGFYIVITKVSSIAAGYVLPMYQVIIVAIIGYMIGLLFMGVYSVAMDALLQCFIVDETNQIAKGKIRPLWAPEQLVDLMDTENEPRAA